MTIYIDTGNRVKIYPVKKKVAKAVMKLLETKSKWDKTKKGCCVVLKEKDSLR